MENRKEGRRGGDMTAGRREDGRGERARPRSASRQHDDPLYPLPGARLASQAAATSRHCCLSNHTAWERLSAPLADDESDNSYQPIYDRDNSVNTNVKIWLQSTLHATQGSLSSVKHSSCLLILINCKDLNESASILQAEPPLVSE